MKARSRIPSLLLAAMAILSVAQAQATSLLVPAGSENGGIGADNLTTFGAQRRKFQDIYAANGFTSRGVDGPILIQRLRYRIAVGTGFATSIPYPGYRLRMSTTSVLPSTMSTTFAANHGADVTTVFTGQVNTIPTVSSTPGGVHVDIQLSTPFLYHPGPGRHLCIEHKMDDPLVTVPLTLRVETAAGRHLHNFNDLPTGIILNTVLSDTPANIAIVDFVPAPGTAWATAYGTGCNTPQPLQLQAVGRPLLGSTQVLEVRQVPAGSGFVALIAGLAPLRPPTDLAAFGMTGCFSHARIDTWYGLVPSAGLAVGNLALPVDTSFVGQSVFTQGAAHAPAANALELVSSNAVELVLGDH